MERTYIKDVTPGVCRVQGFVENFRNKMYKDYFLLIRGRIQPRGYKGDGELEFRVTDIKQLSEVKDGLKEITLTLPAPLLSEEVVKELTSAVKQSKGKMLLKFKILDTEKGVCVTAHASKKRVALSDALCEFIEKHNITYSLT